MSPGDSTREIILSSIQRYYRDWRDAHPEEAVLAEEQQQGVMSDAEIAQFANESDGEVVEV